MDVGLSSAKREEDKKNEKLQKEKMKTSVRKIDKKENKKEREKKKKELRIEDTANLKLGQGKEQKPACTLQPIVPRQKIGLGKLEVLHFSTGQGYSQSK